MDHFEHAPFLKGCGYSTLIGRRSSSQWDAGGVSFQNGRGLGGGENCRCLKHVSWGRNQWLIWSKIWKNISNFGENIVWYSGWGTDIFGTKVNRKLHHVLYLMLTTIVLDPALSSQGGRQSFNLFNRWYKPNTIVRTNLFQPKMLLLCLPNIQTLSPSLYLPSRKSPFLTLLIWSYLHCGALFVIVRA